MTAGTFRLNGSTIRCRCQRSAPARDVSVGFVLSFPPIPPEQHAENKGDQYINNTQQYAVPASILGQLSKTLTRLEWGQLELSRQSDGQFWKTPRSSFPG